MVKSVISLVVILAVGALLGSVLGEGIGSLFPSGMVHDLLTRSVSPGLKGPVILDLNVVTLTFGLAFKMNIMSVVGVVLAAFLYKTLL